MDESSVPLPFVTSSLYPGVVSFSPDVIPESIRKLEINAPLFHEDGCSVPVRGTICTTDSSPQAQQMLSLLTRRNSHSFMLLVAFPENTEGMLPGSIFGSLPFGSFDQTGIKVFVTSQFVPLRDVKQRVS
jgi:hypothetical protein